MAITNTNTTTDTIVSADIYELASFYESIRQTNMPDVDDDASMVGIFGYINEVFMQTMQNAIIMISETTNETIATKAKFTKNVITHALNLGITDINATPAIMRVMLYLPIDYIERNFIELDSTTGKAKFILDRKIPFNIEDFEFHIDYDIIISRVKNSNDTYNYSAMYDLFETGTTNIAHKNPISNINNPYIDTVIQSRINNTNYVAFAVDMHQVTYKSITKNVVTNNVIENKTITFTFDNQIASFDVDVIQNNKIIHLTPIYNGLLDYSVKDGTWCYYEYVSENMIRILFSRDSFVPALGSTVIVNIYESQGASGNFSYNAQLRVSLISETYNNYGGMFAYLYPLNGGRSVGGVDHKSINELKKIIPREATSRGAIINMTDLKNFFNSMASANDCKLYFKKKRDNPFERMYYTYLIMKNNGDIYPTNTINLKLSRDEFTGSGANNNLSINPGTIFYYYDHGNQTVSKDPDVGYATINKPTLVDPDDDNIDYPVTINSDGRQVRVFEYISPFLITIDSDLLASYYMTMMDTDKAFLFDSINTDSELQFISTNMHWSRSFYTTNDSLYDNKYVMTVDIAQNNLQDYNLITTSTDDDGYMVLEDVRLKMYIALYTDETETTPYKYKEGTIISYDSSRYTIRFRFTFTTDDLMDLKNRIKITGLKNCKPEPIQTLDEASNGYGYMNNNTFAKIFILADFGTRPGDADPEDDSITVTESTQKTILYGSDGIGNRTEIESIIPTKNDIIDLFLKNEISKTISGEVINVVSIIQSNAKYLAVVKNYNGDDSESSTSILKYLRNNTTSTFVTETLLNDELSVAVINSFSYEDLSRYTVCNTMTIDGGLDFYYDYTDLMHSNVEVAPVKLYNNGDILYREVTRYDLTGNTFTEYKPVYKTNSSGQYEYNYTIMRIPVVKSGYLSTESLAQVFISAVDELRRYIIECLYVLEDTFDIDFKFVNTWGPSRTFYYTDPTATSYDVSVAVKELNIYSQYGDEDNTDLIVGVLPYEQIINVTKVQGQWGYITSPYVGWIKLSNTNRINTFIDNTAITMKFTLEAESSADKQIANNIIYDIKNFVEDINEINELHIPNIITLITNNYREQLVWFDFLGINNYGIQCKHLYVYEDDNDDVDVVPEFINIATTDDGTFTPMININTNN